MNTRRQERGFTLVTTILLLAVVTVAALIVLDVVEVDLSMVGLQRRSIAAREAAEGGTMELLNDQQALNDLPTFDSPGLTAAIDPLSDSAFQGGQTYRAKVSLVRVVPMAESSLSRVTAVVYRLDVAGQGPDSTRAGIESEIYRTATTRPGVILPKNHAQ